MSKETLPLQYELFSGELVDSRSSSQKRKDQERNSPQQLLMFTTPEMVQFGVNARPWLKDAPQPQLVLEIQETRTPEEIERDLTRAAENNTVSLFGDHTTRFPEDNLPTSPSLPRLIYLAPERSHLDGLRTVFDEHLRHLQSLRASLKQPTTQVEQVDALDQIVPQRSLSRHQRAAPPPHLLRGTLVYLNRLEHPPLLPSPRHISFVEAFKQHEPMFHTVFYRKYPPWILDDAKQEGLLALYRKWLKDKAILEQSSSYVVQAAIYGVSNWRQKGMKVRGKEAALIVDPHGKVIGEPRSHSLERWTDRIDLKLDVAKAVEVVLHQDEEDHDYREIYRVMEDVRHDVPFKQGQQASGLSFRTYKKHRDNVKAELRIQLAEYGPMLKMAARQ